jgi:hypothetical protein
MSINDNGTRLRGLEHGFKSDSLHIVYDTIVFPES